MTKKLSFSEYCKSKDYLRLISENTPQVLEEYELTKYCKFPVVGDKEYVAFKPKDTIEVVWEYLNPDAPTAVKVVVSTSDEDGTKIKPAWGDTKLSSWLKNNTVRSNKT